MFIKINNFLTIKFDAFGCETAALLGPIAQGKIVGQDPPSFDHPMAGQIHIFVAPKRPTDYSEISADDSGDFYNYLPNFAENLHILLYMINYNLILEAQVHE